MGRPRTPTAVLEARGAFDRNPARRREREGEPEITESIGDLPLPVSLAEDDREIEKQIQHIERAVWTDYARIGTWLTGADRSAFGTFCALEARRLLGIASLDQLKELRAVRNECGFSPSSRSKVKVPEKPLAKPTFGGLRRGA